MVAINKSLMLGANEGDSRKTIGKIIVLHETATPDAPAVNIATFEKREWSNNETYVHLAVDDKGAYQIGEFGYVAWGAGNVNIYAPVQIELCNFTDKNRAIAAYRNLIALARDIANQFSVNKTLDDGNKTNGFKTHDWCRINYGGTDHTAPYAYLASLGISKAQFAADLANGVGGTVAVAPSQPAAKPQTATAKAIYALHVLGGQWLDNVVNKNDRDSNGFAGVPNHQHDLLTLQLSTGGRYRVHTREDGWLPWVYKGNKADTVNGCAGVLGHAIDGVQIEANGRNAYYRSQTIKRVGWLAIVTNLNDYAGWYGEPIDRLQVWF